MQREFAADVLRDLLRRIDVENSNEGSHTFLVSTLDRRTDDLRSVRCPAV